MKVKRALNLISFVNLTILLTFSLISCQPQESEEPGISIFMVEVNDGQVQSITKNGKSLGDQIMISQNDTAVIKFSSGDPFRVFVHGYDIEHDVDPEVKSSLEFRIFGEFTGNFPIHMHDIETDSHRSGDDSHGQHKHANANSTHTLISNFVVNPN